MPAVATVVVPGEDALEVRFLEWSAESGSGSPLVVLAHPFLPLRQLQPCAELLRRDRRVVVVEIVDLFGSAGASIDWSGAAAALGRFLTQLDIDRYHLIGLHLGGLLAQQFTVEAAPVAGLRSVTLMASHTGGEHEVPPASLVVDCLAEGLVQGARGDLRHAALSQLIDVSTLRRRPRVVDTLQELVDERRLQAHELEAWWTASESFSVFDSFPEIDLPVLVLHGQLDALTPPENSTVLERQIPGAERVEVADSGHLFFLEDPGTVFAAVQTFVERVETYVP